jgi:hypothetical protein
MQANIINDLLDFETLKGAAAAVELVQLDVDAAVRSVVRTFSASARSKVTRLQVSTLLYCSALHA